MVTDEDDLPPAEEWADPVRLGAKIQLVGAAAIVFGVVLISVPAAFLVAGLMLLAYGWLMETTAADGPWEIDEEGEG